MNMEFTEKLISLVRQYPCLYDYRVKNYKNTSLKERLWEQIAMELDQTSESIRTKWKNLKDGFAKYKKKKNKYGNWIWGPYLDFLDGAAALRSNTRNKTMLDLTPDSPNSAEAKEVAVELFSSFDVGDGTEDVEAASNSANQPALHEFLSLRDPLTSRASRKRHASDEEYTEDILSMHYNNIEKKDSVDLLFDSYAKSLKQMKPRTQAQVKIKLAQIFADAELKDLHSGNTGSQTEQESQMPVFTVLNIPDEHETYSGSGNDNCVKKE